MSDARYYVKGSDSGGQYYREEFDDMDDAIQDAADFALYHEGHYFVVYVLDIRNSEIIYEIEKDG